VAAMADVGRRLRSRVILPMHWFDARGLERFLAQMEGEFRIEVARSPEIEVSRSALPEQPVIVVLEPAAIP
jgi:L-ascorbate metabolism protein UlaG (beta-lactamase superfamily)